MGDSLVRSDRGPRDTTARSLAGLDWVNFFLADVASGLGPFLAVYLLAKRDWNAASIGVVLTIGGIAGLVAQTPAGAIIDATQHKRAWLIGTTALISVQVLDGVAAGIFGALFPLVIADLTRGTGRYNVTFGVASTVQGIGASFSTTVAGVIIVIGGYDLAFLALAGIAFLALLIFFFAMPENRHGRRARPVAAEWRHASDAAADGSALPDAAAS